ncbi:alcohol oxidase [Meira miltonrushii]|uniref:Alcohol oxidase n=1 Tax=Meira miltonrushii TaxID=1280837 RepID=A0A316VMD6_9BASI|nr:alcohol oxidase [Meira miltonrushii]PWN38470.1 alcohol oxidase [Meira miltonrushii]
MNSKEDSLFPFLNQMKGTILTDPSSLSGQSFDIVIVGGGLTGAVAASRLSANSAKKILLVEAGRDSRNDDKIKSFSAYTQAFGDNKYDWDFKTEPQPLSNNKQYPMHQGKGLGGSTSINGGAFTLPPASQIDALGELGNDGWSWDTLKQYNIKFQNYKQPTADQVNKLKVKVDASAHGTNGPVTIGFSDQMYLGPQEDLFIQAQKEAFNAPAFVDLGTGNAGGGSGMIPQYTIPDSGAQRLRVSSATAYLTEDVEKRSNLVILTKTRATKILYASGSHGDAQASGVQLQSGKDGQKYKVNAKNVIVAAGAIRTPVFLEQSGIGDKSIVSGLGVTSRVDLPGVGRNLCEQQKNNVNSGKATQDLGAQSGSPSSAISLNTINQIMKGNSSDVRSYIESNIDQWAQQAVDAGASASKDGLVSQYKLMVKGIFEEQWPVSETFFITLGDSFMQQMWALLSFSRGYVHATSSNTWDAPKLNPRYWSAPIDMDIQVAANRGARRIFNTNAMKSDLQSAESMPGYDKIPQTSDQGDYNQWRDYILNGFESVWHPIGTAAMMPRNLGGVVDSQFKVYGTSNIFVIDSSILPMQLSTHLSSTLYAIAERAADILGKL